MSHYEDVEDDPDESTEADQDSEKLAVYLQAVSAGHDVTTTFTTCKYIQSLLKSDIIEFKSCYLL